MIFKFHCLEHKKLDLHMDNIIRADFISGGSRLAQLCGNAISSSFSRINRKRRLRRIKLPRFNKIVKLFSLLCLSIITLNSTSVLADEQTEVCFYDYNQFGGLFYCTLDDEPDMPSQYYWDINSIRVPDGYVLITYEEDDYVDPLSGQAADDSYLDGWERRIRSYKIMTQQEAGVCFFDYSYYRALFFCTYNDEPNLSSQYLNDINSIKLPPNYELTTYRSANYVDQIATYTGEAGNLSTTDKEIRSFKITNLDEDFDGVLNSNDQCPNTTQGASVDPNGCSADQIDEDSDGVVNSLDQCPATPIGETVDANGCSQSQLDDDNDGVMNDQDLCPATGSGETVNQYGCTQADDNQDADGDGVPDYLDQCANTPSGETANSVGCAPDQIDSDGDGTPDYLDSYPRQSGTQCPAQ